MNSRSVFVVVVHIVVICYWAALLLLSLSEGGLRDSAALMFFLVAGLSFTLAAMRLVSDTEAARAARTALRDELTDLPNRSLFFERLEEASARTARQKKNVAVLFIDLDRFKLVNDTFGHGTGDRLLMEVSRRFKRQVRVGETLARIGGDEFTVVAEGVDSVKGAEVLAERLLRSLSTPIELDGHEFNTAASIGIALALGGEVPPSELVRRADIALYAAKARGRACWQVFEPEIGNYSFELVTLDSGLRKAIERNELCLYFQPQISLSTGATVGVEALVRWENRERGLLQPGAFLPAAEKAGLMNQIDKWVLFEACRLAAGWERNQAGPGLNVSVNVSPSWFQRTGLVDEVEGALTKTGLDAPALKLEIVESAMMEDTDSALAAMEALHQMGVKISIDDFGTGYSSLGYLRQFPIDEVKLDRSFIVEAAHDKKQQAIVQAVVSLAHALELVVTAEGIEISEQLSVLLDAGCDQGQGYIFSRPLPEGAVENFLRKAA